MYHSVFLIDGKVKFFFIKRDFTAANNSERFSAGLFHSQRLFVLSLQPDEVIVGEEIPYGVCNEHIVKALLLKEQ